MKLQSFGLWGRAREDLEQQLAHLSARLDTLESAPEPDHDLSELRGIVARASGHADARIDQLQDRLDKIEADDSKLVEKLKDLTFAVAEGIERVDRSERRIHATIKRARKELEEHGFESPRLEAEAAELQLSDGTASPGGKVPAVPGNVEGAPDAPSSIHGVPASTLRKVRGF